VWAAVAVIGIVTVVLGVGSAAGHAVGLVYNPPAVADGQLYVTSADGHLYALDSDGAPRWAVNASAEITTPATIAGDTVVFGTADGRVLGVAREGGTIEWERELAGIPVGSVATGDQYVYAGAGSRLVAVDREGDIDWEFPTDGFVGAPVVTGERGPYVATSRIQARNGTLYALDGNGTVRWTRETEATIEQVATGDGAVYHTADGRVIATAANGTALWTVELGEVVAQPAVRNGTVVVGTINGTVAAIENGEVTWRYRTDLPVAPTVVDDTVYATTPRGLIAVRDGTELWTRTTGATVLAPPTVGEHVYVGTQVNRSYAVATNGSFAWVNQYSTTTANIPWADDDGGAAFRNPAGAVTRVVGPDGTIVSTETDTSGRSLPLPAGGLFPLLAGGLLAVSALAYGYLRR